MDQFFLSIPPISVPPGRVYRSAALAIAIAWSMRLIGLVSVLILARTLAPADFGIFALAMVTLAVVDVFSALGLRKALLRVKDPDRSYYDTVWTLQLLVLAGLALVLVALGPVMAWFYAEPVLAWIIAILASRFLFYGFANIGIIDFERNLELGRDLKMRLTVRIVSFLLTVAAALILRNYWALVIGAVLQGALHCAASYIFHPFRPRFSLRRRSEMLGPSLWMFLAAAAQTLHSEIERFVVGRIGSFGTVGFYSVSRDLSSIFTHDIATALNRVTFVTTANRGGTLGEAPLRLQAMLGAYALLAAPLGLGLAATAEDAVLVLLGKQWASAAPFLQLIAPASACYAVFKLIISCFQASGKAKFAAMLALSVAVLALLGVTGSAILGAAPLDIAMVALILVAAALVIGIFCLAVEEKIGFGGLVLAASRPFLAATLMFLALRVMAPWSASPLLSLIADVAVGGLLYAAAAALLWIVNGRPPGAEATVADLLATTWRRQRPV